MTKYKREGCFAVPDEGPKCESTNEVIYTGPNLPCTDIRHNSILTVDLEKIDDKICKLFDLYFSLTTTTTTTQH